MYNNMTKYVNEVKRRRIAQIPALVAGKPSVMDLGSGKGQDLRKYMQAGYKSVIFVDNDLDAINELKNRLNAVSKPNIEV